MKTLRNLLTVLLLAPLLVSAHGGVSKNIGDAVVYLNQTPLSPLVNEKVELIFSFTDTKFQPLANTNVQLVLIDTFFGDASRDHTILTQNLQTDDNGTFVYEYQFSKADYYDAEVTFKDPVTGQTDNTGFLVQPRMLLTPKYNWTQTALAAAAGIILGALISGWFFHRRIKRHQQSHDTK